MSRFFRILSFLWMGFFLMALKANALQSTGDPDHFNLENVFDLEYAIDPRISPDGKQIVYVRAFMDIMHDRRRTNLWIINFDGTRHRPLTSGNGNNFSPRWSPDGDRLLYASSPEGESVELYMRWMDTGQAAKITNLTQSPGAVSWSPDGNRIAFTMFVPASSGPMVSLPGKPEGAEWAAPAKIIDDLHYRSDGSGYLKDGFDHIFVVPAEGGTPRQLTSGPYNYNGTPQWTIDGKHLVISANRHDNREYDPANSEIYKINVEDGSIIPLTDRKGPDSNPVISPDGNFIAYTGHDERYQGYQVTHLYVMNADGSGERMITKEFDRDVSRPQWSGDGRGLYFQYNNQGNTKIGFVTLDGNRQKLADNLGGNSIGRPYSGGSFSISPTGRFAYTYSQPSYPADVAVGSANSVVQRITHLNQDLFGHKKLGKAEEIRYKSSYDGREIQGWIVKPPDFDPDKKYPLLLEIHGGPFANYGDRFSAEIQLYAAAGYVILYANPRGSTSYGQEFGNLIHHNYPGQDYDDLMSGVDAVIEKGYIDEDRLYVTGGSGGGVLTAWIIGKTDRFRAAVVAKPVINWYSFVLTSDFPAVFYKYWFPGFPWNYRDHYMDRSPISLVRNVKTPTMLLTGEDDYRTPISETEQYYTALKLQKTEAVMVRIPGASHGIAARPSNMMSKVAHILEWFDKHK